MRLFDACTLLVMLAAIAGAVRPRFRAISYAILIAYSAAFKYSLNPSLILAGAAIALAGRIWKQPKLRWLELPVCLYVLFRGVELLLGR